MQEQVYLAVERAFPTYPYRGLVLADYELELAPTDDVLADINCTTVPIYVNINPPLHSSPDGNPIVLATNSDDRPGVKVLRLHLKCISWGDDYVSVWSHSFMRLIRLVLPTRCFHVMKTQMPSTSFL